MRCMSSLQKATSSGVVHPVVPDLVHQILSSAQRISRPSGLIVTELALLPFETMPGRTGPARPQAASVRTQGKRQRAQHTDGADAPAGNLEPGPAYSHVTWTSSRRSSSSWCRRTLRFEEAV